MHNEHMICTEISSGGRNQSHLRQHGSTIFADRFTSSLLKRCGVVVNV